MDFVAEFSFETRPYLIPIKILRPFNFRASSLVAYARIDSPDASQWVWKTAKYS